MGDYYSGLKGRLREGMDGREQKWLAAKTGVHENQVQRYLASSDPGKNKPPTEFVARYCMALPLLNPAWVLLGGDEPRHRSTSDEPLPPSDVLQALADRLKGEGY